MTNIQIKRLVSLTNPLKNLMSDYLKEFAPTLEDLWTPYLEHDSVITSWSVSPQRKNENGDFEGDFNHPDFYFAFEVDDPRIREDERVFFEVSRKGVLVKDCFELDEKEGGYLEEYEMTHADCLKYVSQLPRPFHFYATSKEQN